MKRGYYIYITYNRVFGGDVEISAIVGHLVKSDIVPAIDAGATAIHVPARYEWV